MPRFNAVPADISNLYTGGNQIFDTRQLGQMLYNEQKMREQKALQEDAQVAKMLQDDVGKVRSADVGLVTDMYGRVKGAKMNLMNPKVKQNPQLYALAQQAHQRAMNDYYTTVRGSQEEKEKDKLLTTFKPDERDDNYGILMAARMQTPLNQLQAFKFNDKVVDLSNPDTYRYMGPNTDWSKAIKDVAGDKRQVYAETRPLDKIGLQSEITPYFYGNSPAQVYSGLLGKISQHQIGRDAALEWDRLPKEQYEAVREAYKNIPADRLRKMGLEKPQELAEYNPDNKAENYARYLAMNYALTSEPEQRTPVYKTNELVKRNLDNADKRAFAAFESGLRQNEEKIKQAAKGGDAQSAIAGHIDRLIEDAKKVNPVEITISGQKTRVHPVPMTESLAKVFEKQNASGEKKTPNMVGVDDNGDFFGIYWMPEIDEKENKYTGRFKKTPSGANMIDGSLTSPISRAAFQGEYANQLLTPTATEKSLSTPTGSVPAPPAPVNKKIENLRNKYGY